MRNQKVFYLLKQLIQEEIGRNFHSKNTDPYTYRDFSDYSIEINGSTLDGFYLTVYHNNEIIYPTTYFKNEFEAQHKSRMVVDKHRVTKMNHEL
jgi:hypothetical protein